MRPPTPAPTPIPAFAPVERPEEPDFSFSLSAHGKLSAKTSLIMTDTAAVVLGAEIVAATTELIDASTVCGTESVVDTTV